MRTPAAVFGIAALIAIAPLAGACQKQQADPPHQEEAPAQKADDRDLSASRQAIAWSQDRLSELDAGVSAVEADAATLRADTRITADRRLADLRAARESYRAKAEDAAANASSWTDTQFDEAQRTLDQSWEDFDTALEAYLDETHADLKRRQAVLAVRLHAREESSSRAIADLRSRAQSLSAEERIKAETRIAALEAQERSARARLGRLEDASEESWRTVIQSFAETRALFAETYLSIRQSFAEAAKDEDGAEGNAK
jgi:hypothetical protein